LAIGDCVGERLLRSKLVDDLFLFRKVEYFWNHDSPILPPKITIYTSQFLLTLPLMEAKMNKLFALISPMLRFTVKFGHVQKHPSFS